MDFKLRGILMIINWLLAVVLVAGIAVIAVSFAEWIKELKENNEEKGNG